MKGTEGESVPCLFERLNQTGLSSFVEFVGEFLVLGVYRAHAAMLDVCVTVCVCVTVNVREAILPIHRCCSK